MAQHGSILRARPGDRLVVRGHYVGAPERDAEVLETLGEGGAPPFVVRWQDDGHVSRLYPSSDAYVQHLESAEEEEQQPASPESPSIAADWEAAVPPSDS